MEKLLEKALAGDIRSIARIISLIENDTPEKDELLKRIYPLSGRAMVLGITGSPRGEEHSYRQSDRKFPATGQEG